MDLCRLFKRHDLQAVLREKHTILIPDYTDILFKVQMRLIRAEVSGGGGALGQIASFWNNSQSALRVRSGPSGLWVGPGVPLGGPRGMGGTPEGGPQRFPRKYGSSSGRTSALTVTPYSRTVP